MISLNGMLLLRWMRLFILNVPRLGAPLVILYFAFFPHDTAKANSVKLEVGGFYEVRPNIWSHYSSPYFFEIVGTCDLVPGCELKIWAVSHSGVWAELFQTELTLWTISTRNDTRETQQFRGCTYSGKRNVTTFEAAQTTVEVWNDRYIADEVFCASEQGHYSSLAITNSWVGQTFFGISIMERD